jgi:AraC-like DNA-binding protein/mannose-6-phosphate isomerase-like protein (cupin superfamily)
MRIKCRTEAKKIFPEITAEMISKLKKPDLSKNILLNARGVDLISVEHFISHHAPNNPTGKSKSSTYHSFNEFVIILKGSMCVEMLGKNVYGKSGDILFYHAGVAHKEQSTRGTEIICIGWEEKRKIEFPVVTHDASKKICFLAKLLFEQDRSSYPYNRLLQEKIFEVIRIELMKTFESEENHPFIGNLKSFMIDNLDKPLTSENMARYIHMSKPYLWKTYKNLTGRTPIEDLRNIRLETAKNMMVTTGLPIKAISSKVGFTNVYLFTRLFKKYFNLPPGHFRKDTDWRKHTVFPK